MPLGTKPLKNVVTDPKGIGDNGQGRVNSSARNEEAAVHDVKIVNVVSAAIQVEDRGLRVFPKLAGTDLVPQTVHGHFGGKIAGFWREVVGLRNNVAPAADLLQNTFPALHQAIER